MTETAAKGSYKTYHADSFEWFAQQRSRSFHAVVTDPPFGNLEYTAKELQKRRDGKGGIWRLPNSRDGFKRAPMPRFTVLSDHDRMAVLAFHLLLAPELYRLLVPGAHVIIASQVLISHLVSQAFDMAGFEVRGQIVRVVKTLRGGDRPKFGEQEFRDVSVIPRSNYEPWLMFRKPCEGTVTENLRKYGTGALRRSSEHSPFADLIYASPARSKERKLADHPSLKPQLLMRALARAALPLSTGTLLDPFMGSGSTIAAASAEGLSSVGVEKDQQYFELASRAIPELAGFAVDPPRAR